MGDELIINLYKINAIKFGNFTLKNGISSPVYIDLRVIISHPDVLVKVSEILWQCSNQLKFSSICGVPYTALPIATCISTAHKIPMLIRRKEAKDYGTKKILEGSFEEGSSCLIVEDVVTTGSSVLETADILINHGLKVTDAVVLLNRQQGGAENLQKKGIKLRHIFTLSEVVNCLCKHKQIDESFVLKIDAFLKESFSKNSKRFLPMNNGEQKEMEIFKSITDEPARSYGGFKNSTSSYARRSEKMQNEVAQKLIQIMELKQSNLCLSADVESSFDLIELVDLVGPLVCMVKTHVDTLDDYSPIIVNELSKLSRKHNFILFEDRKFADIGNTVKNQYAGGTFKPCEWADVVNAHSIPGPGVVQGLKAACKERKDRACLLIAEMSSKGNLATREYTQSTVAMAELFPDFVIGFIATNKVSTNPCHLHFTPGVKLQSGYDNLGQQYLTPDDVIRKRGCDIIIVGRGITQSENRFQTAMAYKTAGWSAYQARLDCR